jgi:hypothetical protein
MERNDTRKKEKGEKQPPKEAAAGPRFTVPAFTWREARELLRKPGPGLRERSVDPMAETAL